ncbi:MAG: hypothetical protein ABL959_01130 [Pyrinomonadaceae bacterium]
MKSVWNVFNLFTHTASLALGIALTASIFVSSALGQEAGLPLPFDTSINPHDFTDTFYRANGIEADSIADRRTGADRWSTISYSSNRRHTNIRVTATFPAYSEKGKVQFWSPLGEITALGFTSDKPGIRLRKVSSLVPIYIFPDPEMQDGPQLMRMRQAPIIDNTMLSAPAIDRDPNPLGLHRLVKVWYTEAAFTLEAGAIMDHFARKNGRSTNGTPIIKTTEDIATLLSLGYITFDDGTRGPDRPFVDTFMISPVITDPTGGAVADDALLFMSVKEGQVLPSEAVFVTQFNCLRDLHRWCTNN